MSALCIQSTLYWLGLFLCFFSAIGLVTLMSSKCRFLTIRVFDSISSDFSFRTRGISLALILNENLVSYLITTTTTTLQSY